MNQEPLTEFSGVAGRVLQRSVSLSSVITGIAVGFNIMFVGALMFAAGAPNAFTFYMQIVIAFGLARFAANGYFGEWGGTIFSSVGGSWAHVATIASRYLSLTIVWLLPLVVLGFNVEATAQVNPQMLAQGAGKLVLFSMLYFLLATLTPPLFLIVSVSAQGYSDIFMPSHWKEQFEGRMGDLFVIFVAYTGTLGMVMILSIAPVVLAFSMNGWMGLFVGGLSLCLLFGLSLNLLGRLCGFYACGELGWSDAKPEPAPAPEEAPRDGGDEPAAVPGLEPEEAVDMPVADPIPVAEPAPAPVGAIPLSPTKPEEPAATQQPDPIPMPAEPIDFELPAMAPADAADRKTPLLDAQRRVEEAMKRFRLEPSHTLSVLTELDKDFAPSPHVLQALAICLHRTGHTNEALVKAREALPLCFERGHATLAAGLFKELRSELERLEFTQEQFLLVASNLTKRGDLATAAKAYSTVISQDPNEMRAVKGLLQVADAILHKKNRPARRGQGLPLPAATLLRLAAGRFHAIGVAGSEAPPGAAGQFLTPPPVPAMLSGMADSIETLIEDWPGQSVLVARDPGSGSWIFLALHDSTLGEMAGGTRLKSYTAPTDALRDAMRLAEGMTHKWAAIGLDAGGAKAVLDVPADLTAAQRRELLLRYGRIIDGMRGTFSTGRDLGTTDEDMLTIAEATRHVHGVDHETRTARDPGPFTAAGVLNAQRVTLEQLHGSRDLNGRSILIQGLGGVGDPLARNLAAEGAALLLSDVDADRAAKLAGELDATVVPPDDVYDTECDIYAPCAVGATVNESTIPRLQCAAVVGSANNQLGDAADADALHRRGILYAPDFMANGGGALAFGLIWRGVTDEPEIRRNLERLGESIGELLREAAARDESPLRAARRRVDERLRAGR